MLVWIDRCINYSPFFKTLQVNHQTPNRSTTSAKGSDAYPASTSYRYKPLAFLVASCGLVARLGEPRVPLVTALAELVVLLVVALLNVTTKLYVSVDGS